MAIMIILSHIYMAPNGGTIHKWLLFGGAIAVGGFFMLSGYGLYAQYKKHGTKYLKKVLLQKIPVLYVFLVMTSVVWVLFNGRGMNAWELFLQISNIGIYIGVSFSPVWFINALLVWYALFAVLLWALDSRRVVGLCVLVAVVLVVDQLLRLSPMYYNGGADSFAVGLVYAFYAQKVNAFMARHAIWLCPILLAGLVFYYFAFTFELFGVFGALVTSVRRMIMCAFIISLVAIVNFPRKVLFFIGKISPGFHLSHTFVLKGFGLVLPHGIFDPIYILVCILTIIASGIAVHYIERGLYWLTSGKFRHKKVDLVANKV